MSESKLVPSRVRETLAATISAAQTAAMNAMADVGALPGMPEAFDRADALLREWGVEVAPPGDPVQEIAAAYGQAAPPEWCASEHRGFDCEKPHGHDGPHSHWVEGSGEQAWED